MNQRRNGDGPQLQLQATPNTKKHNSLQAPGGTDKVTAPVMRLLELGQHGQARLCRYDEVGRVR